MNPTKVRQLLCVLLPNLGSEGCREGAREGVRQLLCVLLFWAAAGRC